MTRRIIYPQTARPVVFGPEAVNVQWLQPFSEPVRKVQINVALSSSGMDSFVAIVTAAAAPPLAWFTQDTLPVRTASQIAAQQAPSSVWPTQIILPVLSWFQPLSEPVRPKGIATCQQQQPVEPLVPILVTLPITWLQEFSRTIWRPTILAAEIPWAPTGPPSPFFPETTTADRWYQEFSKPVWSKTLPTAAQQAFTTSPWGLTQPEAVHVQWLTPLSEPPKRNSLLTAQQQAFASWLVVTVPEVVTVDKWYQDLKFVPWGRSFPAAEQLAWVTSAQAMTQPETTLVSKWFVAFSEPVRVKPALVTAAQSSLVWPTFFAEVITVDKYYIALSEPVRFKPGLGSAPQQALFYPPFVAENITVDKWFSLLSEPVRLKPGLGVGAQLAAFYTFIVETVTVDKWWQDLKFVPWNKKLPVAATQFFTTSPWSLTQPEAVHLNWFVALTEPVRTRWFDAARQQQPIQLINLTPGGLPIEITIGRYLTLPGRTTSVLLDDRVYHD